MINKMINPRIMATFIAICGSLAILPASGEVHFISGSTGADGAFATASDTTLTIPPGGVFNFTTVNIPSGITVTFNPSSSPVVILASGDIVIDGILDVGGQNGQDGSTTLPVSLGGRGGPGSFDGGAGGAAGTATVSAGAGGQGLGPTGGNYGAAASGGNIGRAGAGGTFPSTVVSLIPVLGGSGGSGGGGGAYGSATSPGATGGGGGGGGSLLIASSGNITVNGSLKANGGAGGKNTYPTGGTCSSLSGAGSGGSGGGIRIVTNQFQGIGGLLSAAGGAGGMTVVTSCGGSGVGGGGAGGNGMIRVEALGVTFAGTSSPGASYAPPTVVLPPGIPSLSITSIGGETVPANPSGSFSNVDVAVPSGTANPVLVTVATANMSSGTVRLKVINQYDGTVTTQDLTVAGLNQILNFSITLPTGLSAIVAYTPTPITVASSLMDGLPLVENERLELAKLEATAGGGARVVFLTRSGKEVSAETIFGHVVQVPEK